MKYTISKDVTLDDDYVDVKYRELNTTINQIIELLSAGQQTIIGDFEGQKHQLDISDILYVEWVDNHSCICTDKMVYTSPLTITRMEELLCPKGFVRISKPMIVNIRKVKWISSILNMKLMAELVNGERVVINRHYREDMLSAIFKIGKELKNE